MAAQASSLVNQALNFANNAIAADPSNYYNYLSAAHVAEAAYSLHMANAYDAGVAAYLAAIKQNPQNPSLYVSLARFQATGNKLDDAIQTIGTSLQVKSNYLDAVFLLSQVEAAKGNMADAVTAAQFAIKLNPENPLLYFQLGLFQYTAGSYADAVTSLAQAVKLQSDYAIAKYFLGLAEARVGHYSDAAIQFSDLVKANPGNNELQLILSSLQAGKSPFVGATAPATIATPGKLSSLPVPESKK
jgi:tetratricopeptide (TPR) repeat protein